MDDICSVPWTEECFFLQEAVDGSTFEEKKGPWSMRKKERTIVDEVGAGMLQKAWKSGRQLLCLLFKI